ncbi:glycine-rich domain-containing protein [Trinickia sp.]|uniref:glycine-rich domain-containing protein n=1 Tax=Trinickia sp. TaxID=2571163 RepID=UPI003F7D4C42
MQTTKRGIAAMYQAIDELDFSRIKAKLMYRREGVVALRRIERAEAGYRQFLKLAAKYPDAPIVPSEEVDEFWHMHILDTQRYGADCERIFGYMIHHDPYSGIDGAQDEARHLALAATSDELAAREFGVAEDAEAVAYCVKPEAKGDAKAYCVKPEAKGDAKAYCVKPEAKSDAKAYCVKPEAKSDAKAYCVKPEAKGDAKAYCVKPEAKGDAKAYCVKPEAKSDAKAYCVKPEAKNEARAYCVRPEAMAMIDPVRQVAAPAWRRCA